MAVQSLAMRTMMLGGDPGIPTVPRRAVAVTAKGYTLYSDDGIEWSSPSLLDISPLSSATISSIVYGNGMFLVSISSASAVSRPILRSYDGITWAKSASLTRALKNGSFVNGKFVYSQQASTAAWANISTPDGITFTTASFSGSFSPTLPMVYGNGKYLLVGTSGNMWYSTDFNTFSHITVGSSNFVACAYGNGVFVASRDTAVDPVLYSTDCITWTPIIRDVGGIPFRAIYFDGVRFIASCLGYSYYSSDGIIWSILRDKKNNAMQLIYNGARYLGRGDYNIGYTKILSTLSGAYDDMFYVRKSTDKTVHGNVVGIAVAE